MLYVYMPAGFGGKKCVEKTGVYEVAHWLNNSYYKSEVILQVISPKPPRVYGVPNRKIVIGGMPCVDTQNK